MKDGARRFLFWACFVSLVATSFGFISRVFMLGDWAKVFKLSETQLGEIFGAGLWPFAISIVLFSLIVDKIGYGRAIWFAFVCHIVSGIMTLTATGYYSLYWAAFIGALGAGTIEAIINPVIASVYPREKTKWLNVLHAGWPGGLMLAGMLTIFLGAIGYNQPEHWKIKVAIVFLPVAIYGAMMLKCKFPVQERVAAGIPYKDMLAEPGGVGIFIVVFLILQELGRVLIENWEFSFHNQIFLIISGISLAIALGYGFYTRSAGRPMYILLLLVMLLLATTELGTDGWIKELLTPEMKAFGLDAGWVLVYTSGIMMVLRFATGPILKVTKLNPLGLLAVSCCMVILGLSTLSRLETGAGALLFLLAATIYGAGQCFFWPTTLGFISERFPRGGALTINAIAGVGMLGVGILGGPWLGYIQNTTIEKELKKQTPELYAKVIGADKHSMFGHYKPLDQEKLDSMTPSIKKLENMKKQYHERWEGKASEETIEEMLQDQPEFVDLKSSDSYAEQQKLLDSISKVQKIGKSEALFKVCLLPLIMLVSYIGLMLHFRGQGGYKPIELDTGQDERGAEEPSPEPAAPAGKPDSAPSDDAPASETEEPPEETGTAAEDAPNPAEPGEPESPETDEGKEKS